MTKIEEKNWVQQPQVILVLLRPSAQHVMPIVLEFFKDHLDIGRLGKLIMVPCVID